MTIQRLRPSLELLQDERVLVQAWKKTAAHIRAHNWFADSLELDEAALDLPNFLESIRTRLRRPKEYRTAPLRLVPAPKSWPWQAEIVGDGVRWAPLPPKRPGDQPRLRPLGHVTLSDQVVATALMLCLADRVETLQRDPRPASGLEHVVSFGNRLLCDAVKPGRLEHRWGASALYRGYFEDYRTFLNSPKRLAAEVEPTEGTLRVVHSDLKNFYDTVRPSDLARAVRRLRRKGDDAEFFELAESARSNRITI